MYINAKNRLLTTKDVADLLYIHINTVRRWSNQGLLKSYRIGPRKDRRFVYGDILNFRDNNGYVSLINK